MSEANLNEVKIIESIPMSQERIDEEINLSLDDCKVIDSIPIKIVEPGNYCLTKDFETRETAIEIQSNDVKIDMAGHRISGPGNPASQSVGIYLDSQSNISIKNGTIEGFFYGIRASAPYDQITLGPDSAASDISIQNLVLLDNGFRGIRVDASRALIQSNLVQSTGGTTVFDDAYSMGIEIIGPDCRIQGNWIKDTYPVGVGEGVGIS